jgi:serine/threonine-protein kinase
MPMELSTVERAVWHLPEREGNVVTWHKITRVRSARLVLNHHNVPAEGEIIANRFRLVRELGRGSMGTVWLAHHLTLEVPCAIKFIVTEGTDDPNYRTRFHIEARTIAQVQSPNVVRVLDHSVSDEAAPYIAMEFLEGEDLWSRLHRVGRLDPSATYEIVSQVARGLSKAHGAGIIHRDLKPENIFLAREGEEEVVKLLDFGIAKWQAPSLLDETEGLVGTPEYMSPELARGAAGADCRSDLWALSAIAYQCLTGQLPFAGDSLTETLDAITIGAVPVPSEVAPHVSRNFDRWWAQATSRAIDQRFQNAFELADALGETLGFTAVRRGESTPPRAAAMSSPPTEATFVSPVDHCETLPYRPRKRRVWRPRVRALGAGFVVAVIAMMVATGRHDAPVARANRTAPRLAAVESLPMLAREAPPRFAAEPRAPPIDSKVGVRGVTAPLPSAETSPRPKVFPKVLKTGAPPKKEKAPVDFGI